MRRAAEQRHVVADDADARALGPFSTTQSSSRQPSPVRMAAFCPCLSLVQPITCKPLTITWLTPTAGDEGVRQSGRVERRAGVKDDRSAPPAVPPLETDHRLAVRAALHANRSPGFARAIAAPIGCRRRSTISRPAGGATTVTRIGAGRGHASFVVDRLGDQVVGPRLHVRSRRS